MTKPFIPILVLGSFPELLSAEQAKTLTTMFRMLWRHPSLDIRITNTNGKHLGKYLFYAAHGEAMASSRSVREMCTDVQPVLKHDHAYYQCMADEVGITAEALQKELAREHRVELIDHMAYSPNNAYKMALIIGGGETTLEEYKKCKNRIKTCISLPEYRGTGATLYEEITGYLNPTQADVYRSMYREINPKPLWEVIADLL